MKARVLTALALIPVVLAAVLWVPPWPLAFLGAIAFSIGHAELARFAGFKKSRVPVLGPILFLGVLALPGYVSSILLVRALLVMFAIGICASDSLPRRPRSAPLLEIASLWLAAPLAGMLLWRSLDMRSDGFDWHSPILLTLLPLWVGDTLAIFVGRAWGKHPMAPKLSPKKTWEGGLANFVGCLGMSLALVQWCNLSVAAGVLAGFATGVLGQVGDLFESSIKRRVDLKDSGTLLPGHGGLLDRIDSFLFSSLFVAIACTFY